MTLWIATLGGLLVLLLVLVDFFRTVALPSSTGWLVMVVCRVLWSASRPGDHRILGRAVGPVAMLVTVLAWAGLLVLGAALVYWPRMPMEFSHGAALGPGQRSPFLDSLYVSAVYAATLGLGDIVPRTGWLRLMVPAQAMLGFGVFTAAISWILQIFPALTRRRALALHLDGLHRVQAASVIGEQGAGASATLLQTLSLRVSEIAVDLEQYEETYFFRDAGPHSSLPRTAPYLVDLITAADRSTDPEVRAAGRVLMSSVQRLGMVLQPLVRTTPGDAAEDVLQAYCRDHRLEACRA